VGRSFKASGRTYNDFVQTDASINPGNSGGPLLNIDGEIIGINTAIFAGAQGIGFAIPSEKVKRIVAELTHFGKVRPAWVGIEVQRLTGRSGSSMGWDRNYGVLVAAIEPGSPAEKAGVQRGDIIAEVGGTPVVGTEDFDLRMRGYPARTPIPFGLYREGKAMSLTVTAVEFPAKLAESLAWERLGLRVKPGHGGLVISGVRRGSSAAEIGLEDGDVIVRLNNQPMNTLQVFHEALIAARASKSVLLLLRRGRTGYYITLPF
jgi:serine protease Do